MLADLVANNEELQKAAAERNAVEKLADFLLREEVPSKQLEGVLWGLSELCSKLEESRRQLLELQVCIYFCLNLAHKDWGHLRKDCKTLSVSFRLASI